MNDVSGGDLPTDLTLKAKQTGMKQVYAHKVHYKVPLEECHDMTGEEPVGTKWLKTKVGDESDYNIRARLDAQVFNKGKLEATFAATLPWEAEKMLFSLSVIEGICYGPGWQYKMEII